MPESLDYLTDDEIRVFFHVIDNPRDKLIFRLMLFQGLRVSEVVGETLDYWTKNGVRIKNQDIPKGKIFAPNKVYNIGEDRYCHHQTTIEGLFWQSIDWNNGVVKIKGKGKKIRSNWLHEDIISQLIAYAFMVNPGEDVRFMVGRIFDIEPPQVRVLCKKYAQKAGIKRHVHPHRFRHTFSHAFLNSGGDIETLKELLGHSSILTTAKYVKKNPEEVIRKMKDAGETFAKRGWTGG